MPVKIDVKPQQKMSDGPWAHGVGRLTLRASYSESEFKGADRTDEEYDTGVGARYNLNRYFYVAADYRFQARESTSALNDYDRHQIFVRLGARY